MAKKREDQRSRIAKAQAEPLRMLMLLAKGHEKCGSYYSAEEIREQVRKLRKALRDNTGERGGGR